MSRSEYEKRSCNIRHDHPSHLWIPRRGQGARCPGIGGSTGIVLVDTNDEALVNRVAQNWCVHEGVGENCQPCWFDADNFIVALLAALRETP